MADFAPELEGRIYIVCTARGFQYGNGYMRKEQNLSGTWSLGSSMPGMAPIPAPVPGDVRSALIRASLIEEPLHGLNARQSRRVENKRWTYERDFVLPRGFLRDRVEVVFEGLDTTAEILINGRQAGQTSNALVPHSLDATGLVKPGKNTLTVRIDDGVHAAKGRELEKYGQSPENDGWKIWIRKPYYTFGADFSPKMVTCGIWRPVTLQSFSRAAIRDCFIKTELVGQDALVTCEIELESFAPAPLHLTLEARFCGKADKIRVTARKGMNRFSITRRIRNPELWWPNGMGKPVLHDFLLEAREGDTLVDRHRTRFGIRSVRLLRKKLPPPERGKSFIFEINGKALFAKGACWVPPDALPARIAKTKYRHLVADAAAAHFNMLRVWGGAVYEDDAFYRACDEHGILVWQDFMFACAMVPDDDAGFRRTIQEESEKAVRRLRNHPCIALWCGNNENHEAHAEGWIGNPRDKKRIFYGKKIYHGILPRACKKWDGTRPYWPGSPYGGPFPNSDSEGDMHAWTVSLHGGYPSGRVDYRNYRRVRGKFISEYGLMSAPCAASVKQYLSPRDRRLDSKAFQFHVNRMSHAFKSDNGPGLVERQIDLFWGDHLRLGLEDFIRVSQLIQGEGYKYAIEHLRRRRPYCGGSLFWMYADMWGEVGWSVVDYYLNKKLSYYLVKRAYQPLIVSIKEEEYGASVWIINDTPHDHEAELEYGLKTFTGEPGRVTFGMGAEKITRKTVRIRARSTRKVATDSLDLFKAENFYFARLKVGGKVASENVHLAHPLPNMSLPPARVVHKITGNTVRLTTDCYAHQVVLELPPGVGVEDNAFSILPGESKSVKLTGDPGLFKKIRVSWYNRGNSGQRRAFCIAPDRV